MQKIKLTKKVIIELFVIAGLFLVLLFFAVSQKVAIGQKYQQVYFNGELVGNVANHVSVDDAVHEVRRELAAESDEPLCMDYEYSSSKANHWFTSLMTEDALKEALKEKMKVSEIETQVRAYTVAIEGYRGNFKSMDEVTEFLNTVKNEADTEGQFTTQISKEAGHISGIYTAQLTEVDPEENIEVIPEETLADQVSAGANGAFTYQMEYAMANPKDDSYETGTVGMEFIERVEVYEKYISGDALSDVEKQVEEVTKEKETNKIYVVESGDCLSVIALDHDTKVADIMALNGLENADSLREGQELIIAVPEPELKIRLTVGEVYEEDYEEEPVIKENDSWYTNQEEVLEEGVAGHRERNDIVVYENGAEVSRELAHQKIMTAAKAAVVERGTIVPPTYIKPLAGGRFTSGFGRRWGRMHKGVDWACPIGTTVYASCAGTVIQASYNGGYGNNVVISHADGRLTRYAHNSKLLVKVGQKVEQGEPIALRGSTGRSTGPHVHFEIYIGGAAVNPLKYISN